MWPLDTVFISLYTGSGGKPDFVSIAGIQISHFGGASCREKLVDELARGKAMEKVMEHGAFDHHSIFINQKSINDGRIVIFYIDI